MAGTLQRLSVTKTRAVLKGQRQKAEGTDLMMNAQHACFLMRGTRARHTRQSLC